MGLSGPPRATIANELLVANSSRRRLETVEVRMLKDGHGITSHERRPREIKPKAGDVLQVSSDLADNWGAAGICAPVSPADDQPTVPAAETIGAVPPLAEAPEVAQAPAAKPVAPSKTRSRGRKSRRSEKK